MAIKTREIWYSGFHTSDPSAPAPRGVRVTEKNYLDVAVWVGGNTASSIEVSSAGDETDHKIKLYTDRGNRIRVARVGDVVAKLGKDKFIVYKEALFAEHAGFVGAKKK